MKTRFVLVLCIMLIGNCCIQVWLKNLYDPDWKELRAKAEAALRCASKVANHLGFY